MANADENERLTRRADLVDEMAEALAGLVSNACAAADIQPDGTHRIDATEDEWNAHVQATTRANAALSRYRAAVGDK